jgi:flagellar protein FlaG
VAAPQQDLKERLALIQAVRAVNETSFYGQRSELTFSVDRDTRRSVVRIVDKKTREVIEQIPTEQVLRLAEELKGG